MPSYYDIDTILAEEELLVVKPSFDFSLLAHLDPDSSHLQRRSRKRPRGDDDDGIEKDHDDNDTADNSNGGLPEGTKIKMPLWAVERWALLGFIRFPSLPRHYGRKMKERLEADPVSVDLRSKNEHYFQTGMLLVNLLLRASHVALRHSSASRRSRQSAAQNAHTIAMEQSAQQARMLQRCLLSTMMGRRLCRNFDWALSSLDSNGMEDDVSSHVNKLTELERNMFGRGVEASGAVGRWREFGCARMGISGVVLKMQQRNQQHSVQTAGAGKEEKPTKKRVVSPVGGEATRAF